MRFIKNADGCAARRPASSTTRARPSSTTSVKSSSLADRRPELIRDLRVTFRRRVNAADVEPVIRARRVTLARLVIELVAVATEELAQEGHVALGVDRGLHVLLAQIDERGHAFLIGA